MNIDDTYHDLLARMATGPVRHLDDTARNMLADMDPGCEHEWVNGECPECGATDD